MTTLYYLINQGVFKEFLLPLIFFFSFFIILKCEMRIPIEIYGRAIGIKKIIIIIESWY